MFFNPSESRAEWARHEDKDSVLRAELIDGVFSGTIPIVDFGLGIGLFSVTAATGDFADWVGLVIPFTSDCGNLDASGNSSYVNHYSAAVPEPSTAALASLGFLCLGIFGPALRGRSPRPCTRVIRTR